MSALTKAAPPLARRAREAAAVALAAALLWSALGAAPWGARAQTPQPPAPAGAEAPLAQQESLATSEVPLRADAELQQLEQERQRRQNAADVDEVARLLPDTLTALRDMGASLDARLPRVSSFDALLDIERRFIELRTRLEIWTQGVALRARQSDDELARLEQRSELWTRTLADMRREQAPESVIASVRRVRSELEEGTKEARALRNRLLTLQGELGAGSDLAATALGKIATRQEAMLADLLLRNEPPIWEMRADPPGARPFDVRLAEQLEEQRTGFLRLLDEQTERVLLQLLLLVGVAAALRAARPRARSWRTGEAAPSEVSLVFEHPYAMALLIALVATRWIYVDLPPAAQEAADVLTLFPALVLISPFVAKTLRPALLVLAGFYVLDQLRDLSEGLPVVERTIFLTEMVLGALASVWLLRRVHSNGRLTLLASGSREVAPLALRVLGIAFGATFFLGALGFMRVAQLAGNGLLGSSYVAVLLYAGVQIAQGMVALALRSRVLRPVRSLARSASRLESQLRWGLRVLGVGLWALITLNLLALYRPLVAAASSVLDAQLAVGSLALSLRDVIAFVFTIAAAFWLSRLIEAVLDHDVYPRLHTPRGTAYAVSTLLRYAIVLLGFMAAVSAMGFDTDRLTVLVGAFGVGLGFGLQTIVNNFVSGLILLFERPVQLGDTIEIGGAQGKVHRIGIRATVVRAFDGSDVTIPNGQLLSERLKNWTMADRHRRIEIPVGVAYGSDPDAVIQLLTTAAREHKNILALPPPTGLFQGFGASALDFLLYAWVSEHDDWASTRSDIVRAVHRSLREQGIEIPYPQQEVRLHPATPRHTSPDGNGASAQVKAPTR